MQLVGVFGAVIVITTVVSLFANVVWLSHYFLKRVTRRTSSLVGHIAGDDQFGAIFEAAPVGVIVFDAGNENRAIFANRAWYEEFLFQHNHTLGATTLEMNVWVDVADRQLLLGQLSSASSTAVIDTQLRRADGTVMWYHLAASRVVTADRDLIICAGYNIEAQRRSDKALKESGELFAQVFDIVPEAIAITEKSTGNVVSVNRFWETQLGYTKSAVLGKTANELRVWVDLNAVGAMGQRFARQGMVDAEPLDIRRFDGSVVHMEVSARQMELQASQCTIWVFRDMSAQRLAEQALHDANATLEQRVMQRTLDLSEALNLLQRTQDELVESERRMVGAMAATGEGMWDLNLETRRFFCNARWCEMYGLDPLENDLDTTVATHLVHEDDAVVVAARLRECVLHGVPYRSEHRMRRRDGTVVWVADRGDVYKRSASGHTMRIVGSSADITDRKLAALALEQAKERAEAVNAELQSALVDLRHAQDRLVQSEKMGSMEALLIGVAHDLNTPLGNALTTASALQHQVHALSQALSKGEMRRTQLDAFMEHCRMAADLMEANTARAAKLVATFRQLTVDRASLYRGPFALAGAAAQSAREVASSVVLKQLHIRQLISTDIELDSYREAVTQVLTNLLQNAVIHAMDHDKPLTIVLEAHAAVWQDRAAVRVVVGDDGLGMEPEVAKRAFDPYFTTRLGQGSSGLGLYQVYNLVHSALGGTLSLDSFPGQGTRVTLILPLCAPDAPNEVQRTNHCVS